MPTTTKTTSAVQQLRADLALALRAAAWHGLSEGVCNHFSVAVDDETFLVNPQGLHWSEITANDVVLAHKDGRVLEGDFEVEPTAFYIHAALHFIADYPVVLHTHMPYATSLCLTKAGGIDPLLSQNSVRFYGRIGIDSHYNGLALDYDEGQRIAEASGGKEVFFLANHGVVVTGPTLAYAYDDLYYLERAAKFEVYARSTQLGLNPIEHEIARKTAKQMQGERQQSNLFFEALRRLLPE